MKKLMQKELKEFGKGLVTKTLTVGVLVTALALVLVLEDTIRGQEGSPASAEESLGTAAPVAPVAAVPAEALPVPAAPVAEGVVSAAEAGSEDAAAAVVEETAGAPVAEMADSPVAEAEAVPEPVAVAQVLDRGLVDNDAPAPAAPPSGTGPRVTPASNTNPDRPADGPRYSPAAPSGQAAAASSPPVDPAGVNDPGLNGSTSNATQKEFNRAMDGSGGADTSDAGAAPGEERVKNLTFKQVDLSAVLQALAEADPRQKLNIVAGKDVTGKVTATFYDVSRDEALKAVLDMNGYGYRRVGNMVYVYTKDQLKQLAVTEAKVETRVIRLNYLNVDEAQTVIKPVLSKSAIVATTSRAKEGIPSGGDAVGGDGNSLSDVLVVTDFSDNVRKVEKILKELDIRPKQVLVEATVLQVTLNDDTNLGVDFNALAGVDFRSITTAPVGTFPVLNPGAVLTTATAGVPDIPFGAAGTNGFATPGRGFQIGVITNDISFFVQALETVEDVNVLSNPKVLALNKQRAEVIVGRRLGYRTTTVSQTTAIESIEFLDTGTQLQFRPFISDEGYIRMEIHPEVSNGSISGLGLPSETTTEVTCNVIVRDGHTIVIGGLFDETSTMDKAQVPGLGSIPVLGALMRNEHSQTLRREIIILLTPHIVDDGQANAEGQETLDRIERTMTGLRSRFPLYSREKLTQIYLGDAQKYYERYVQSNSAADRNLALWNLKLARHVAPNNQQVYSLLNKLETEESYHLPKLQCESILWKRMRESGLLDRLPPPPSEKSIPIGQEGPAKVSTGSRKADGKSAVTADKPAPASPVATVAPAAPVTVARNVTPVAVEAPVAVERTVTVEQPVAVELPVKVETTVDQPAAPQSVDSSAGRAPNVSRELPQGGDGMGSALMQALLKS